MRNQTSTVEGQITRQMGSPRPWKIHRTGDKLSLTDANGKFILRKVVSSLPSIEAYNKLLADFDLIVASVNAGSSTASGSTKEGAEGLRDEAPAASEQSTH